jgi:hypothetical protein
MLAILFEFTKGNPDARKNANIYALIFFILGIIAFFTNTLQSTFFSKVG